MKKNLSTILVLLPIFLSANTSNYSNQENVSAKLYKTDSLHKYINIPKVPKQYSLEFGYRNLFSVIDNSVSPFVNSASHGYGFLFDYAWQLGGLNKKRPAIFLSVPMGYTVLMPDNSTSKRVSMLNYGWTTRHELAVNKPVIPYVSYGLLLNTLKIDGTPGGLMGHQTQFEGGLNFNTKSRLKYFAKVQYSYTSYQKLGARERIHLQFADVRVGVRF